MLRTCNRCVSVGRGIDCTSRAARWVGTPDASRVGCLRAQWVSDVVLVQGALCRMLTVAVVAGAPQDDRTLLHRFREQAA